MKIIYKNKVYKFNKEKLINNILCIIGFIIFILLYGLAGASDVASGIL